MLVANRDGTGMERAMAMLMAVGGVILCAGMTWSFSKKIDQLMLAALVGMIMMVISLVAPVVSICITFIYLAILGDVRRFFVFQDGVLENDPLLMVGPAVAGMLVLMPFLHSKFDFNSRLPKMILVLMGLMLVQVFNPLQGGLMVGLAGGLFYFVPLLWFWIGQAYGTEENLRIIMFRVVSVIGVAACALGLWQTFVDFLPYQAEWIAIMKTRYLALNVGSRVRPFAFFVSPAEFAHYCTVLTMMAFAPLARGKIRPIVLLAPLAVACIIFQGGRGPIVLTAAGCIWIWALSARNLSGIVVLGRLAIATAVGVAVIVVFFTFVADSSVNSNLAPILKRQAAGLLNPLDRQESTAVDHLMMGGWGIYTGLTNPWGLGLGASTIAGVKYAESTTEVASTEMDVSNMFVSLGLVGGVLYIMIMCSIYKKAWQLVWRTQSITSVMIFGLLISQMPQWLNGGHYAVSAIIWFCVGTLDRLHKESENEAKELAPA